jgi:hypothetical protein
MTQSHGRHGTRQGTRATSHRGTPKRLWTTTTQISTGIGALMAMTMLHLWVVW